MATIIKGQINEKLENGELQVIHPETDAEVVITNDTKQFVTKEQKEGLDALIQKDKNDEFGKVDDVQEYDGTSLVASKIAKLKDYAVKENGKIQLKDLPDAILGQLLFGGTINQTGEATLTENFKTRYSVATDTITLTSEDASKYEGAYFIAQDSDTFTNVTIIDVANVSTGDWLVSLGTSWSKIDNTDAVSSVNGKTGAVTINKSDVGLANVENTKDSEKDVNSAKKLTTSITISNTGDIEGTTLTDLSTDVDLNLTLSDTGVSEGTYSAVRVDTKGRVTSGGQVLEVGESGQETPSSSLVVGGIFFKRLD